MAARSITHLLVGPTTDYADATQCTIKLKEREVRMSTDKRRSQIIEHFKTERMNLRALASALLRGQVIEYVLVLPSTDEHNPALRSLRLMLMLDSIVRREHVVADDLSLIVCVVDRGGALRGRRFTPATAQFVDLLDVVAPVDVNMQFDARRQLAIDVHTFLIAVLWPHFAAVRGELLHEADVLGS